MKLALVATLALFTGCAPMSGVSGISAISISSMKSAEAVGLTQEGKSHLLMELDSRYEVKQ